jgi:hypothetical protein
MLFSSDFMELVIYIKDKIVTTTQGTFWMNDPNIFDDIVKAGSDSLFQKLESLDIYGQKICKIAHMR